MKKLVLFAFCLYSVMAFAQDEVSLVVSADGATKTQAIDNALRSAIEQTYGTFVSANTKILNDELVKDEIATVSSGNIKKYKEVVSVLLPNGNTSVTLDVTVSLKKLIKYAKSKGSECEFAGATFGANARLYAFNKRNETLAIGKMIEQLENLRPVYDYDINVSEPQTVDNGKTANIGIQITVKSNDKTKVFNEIIQNTIMSLAMTEKQIKPLQDAGFEFVPIGICINDNLKGLSIVYNEYIYVKPKIIYYFYTKALYLLDDILLASIYDFSINDNNGNNFAIYDKNRKDYRFYPQIGHYCIPSSNLYNKYPIWSFMKNDGAIPSVEANARNASLLIINTGKIIWRFPRITFQVSMDDVNKISKINISPKKRELPINDNKIDEKKDWRKIRELKNPSGIFTSFIKEQ